MSLGYLKASQEFMSSRVAEVEAPSLKINLRLD